MNKAILFFLLLLTALIGCQQNNGELTTISTVKNSNVDTLTAPDTNDFPKGIYGESVRYGRELIINTPYYIGINGTKGSYTNNAMTCQNCHLKAGTRNYGLSLITSNARYPQYRARENSILNLSQRVNNCIERPHNGIPLPLESKEMLAFVSYIQWLGTRTEVGKIVKGDKGIELDFPDRAADPKLGEKLYNKHCVTCHLKDGSGLLDSNKVAFIYPALWGKESYQPGSSMHRVVKMARFIKANMPFGTHWSKPVLTDEEVLDISAFVNDDTMHERPENKTMHKSYPDINYKPIDFHIGPYVDTFPESQHKFGPYKPIIDFYENKGLKVSW